MIENDLFTKTVAEASAEDYKDIGAEDFECKSSPLCHIVIGLLIAAVVVTLTTIGIVVYN